MTTKRSYSIIIVTWNALHHLKRFLPAVMKTEQIPFEVIIADNASTDGSAEWIKTNFPSCKIVTLEKNWGYCGGNNRAAEFATGEILLFLNNDVHPAPDWLVNLDPVFDDPDVAAAQPKILSSDVPDQFEYAGAAGGFLDVWGYPFCRGRIFGTTERDNGQYDEMIPVFWASGAALAIRTEEFFKIGKFDEHFMFHMEEIDLCWRLQNSGLKIVCEPASFVYHLGGGSLPAGSAKKVFYNFRNSLQMIWKNASTSWLLHRFFFRLTLDGVAACRFLLTGRIASFFAIVLAHFNFYFRWPGIHKERRDLLKKRRHFGEPEQMLPVNILTEYFFKKRRTFSDVRKALEQKNSV